jgi:hypothetical protein
MSIEKLMKRTNENIILGIGEKGGVFLFSLLTSSPSFYLIGNPNPHNPSIHLYFLKKKICSFQSRQSTFK